MADRPIAARLGLVGVAGSGKTSLFCALTGTEYARAVASTGKSIAATAKRKRAEDFPLRQRGFHWINEYPFNR